MRVEQDYTQFKTAKEQFDTLVMRWNDVALRVQSNRKMRKSLVDVEALRARGKLAANETYIAVRLIDQNIQREMPQHMAYLKQSRRLAIFEPKDNRAKSLLGPAIDEIEGEFTRVLTFPGWELEFTKWIDAAKLHGWSWLRVSFEKDHDGHTCMDHISTEKLMFDLRVNSIQDSKMVIETHKISLVSLEEMAADIGIKEGDLDKLRDKVKEANTGPDVFLYEVFFKHEGLVWRGWMSKEIAHWLKEPEPFYNGVDEEKISLLPMGFDVRQQSSWQKVYETEYPYTPFFFRMTEEGEVLAHEGRGSLDYYKQDAASSMWSAFVNGCMTASNVMWCPENQGEEQGGTAPKQINVEIGNGNIWDRPMKAFTAPYPDPMLPKAIDMLQVQNAEETAQVAWAVNNRKDTRKTATEVQAATAQNAQITSVDVMMFSIALREVYTKAWRIVQSQALQQLIVFAPDDQGQNKVGVIKLEYAIKAAGDVDYIAKQERIAMLQQDLTMFMNTALGPQLMEDYLKVRYPDLADKYITALRQGMQAQAQQQTALIGNLANLLSQAVTDEAGNLRPEWQQHAGDLANLKQQVIAATGAQQNAQQ